MILMIMITILYIFLNSDDFFKFIMELFYLKDIIVLLSVTKIAS